MTKMNVAAAALLSLVVPAAPAIAQSVSTIAVTTDRQDFTKGYGSLSSVALEFKHKTDDTTLVMTPIYGERRLPPLRARSAGFDGTIYRSWTNRISTRTRLFVSENQPVFARLDITQELTIGVADTTTATIGGRWARYFGGQEVTFLSVGASQYFKGGSVSYRLTHTKPNGKDAFLSHLMNFTLNDRRGTGKTRLWLSTGAASLAPSQLDQNFSGHDRAALLQRVQPFSRSLNLIASAGVSSLALPTRRVTGTEFAMGLAFSW